MRAKVTPSTPTMRTGSGIVTVPQPSRGLTRMFFFHVALPMPLSTGRALAPAP